MASRCLKMSVVNRSASLSLLLIPLLALFLCGTVNAQDDGKEGEAIALFNKGQDAHEKGDLKTAIDLYEKALKIIPEFPEAELQRGSALLSLGRVDESEAAYRAAVKLREDWSLALAQLGSLLVRRGKLDEAGSVLTRAIAADPDNTPAWVALALLKIKTKVDDKELREIYKKILSMSAAAKPTAAVWSARASLENALNERKAASLSAARSLEIDPKNISMLSLLAANAIADDDFSPCCAAWAGFFLDCCAGAAGAASALSCVGASETIGHGHRLRAKNASKATFASGEFRRSLKILAS